MSAQYAEKSSEIGAQGFDEAASQWEVLALITDGEANNPRKEYTELLSVCVHTGGSYVCERIVTANHPSEEQDHHVHTFLSLREIKSFFGESAMANRLYSEIETVLGVPVLYEYND